MSELLKAYTVLERLKVWIVAEISPLLWTVHPCLQVLRYIFPV